MPIESVVADANVLWSAVAGKAALRVFTDCELTVYVTRFNVDEVSEYLPVMAAQYNLPVEFLEMQWKLLPVKIHPEQRYPAWSPKGNQMAYEYAETSGTSGRSDLNRKHGHHNPQGSGVTFSPATRKPGCK